MPSDDTGHWLLLGGQRKSGSLEIQIMLSMWHLLHGHGPSFGFPALSQKISLFDVRACSGISG